MYAPGLPRYIGEMKSVEQKNERIVRSHVFHLLHEEESKLKKSTFLIEFSEIKV